MSELFVYESDDDNITYTTISKVENTEKNLIEKTESEVSNQTQRILPDCIMQQQIPTFS